MLKKLLSYFFFLLLGLCMLAIPLLRDFHFESAMLAGVIACYWAGLRSAYPVTKHDFFQSLHILLHVYLLGAPLFLNALLTGCLTFDGFGFWLLIPVPSAYFGAAIGRLVRHFKIPYAKFTTLFILTFVALGIWLMEFLQFPQVYFFNHVWGLWPGPIYDETVRLGGSFIFFRWLTCLWILLLWMIPTWNKDFQSKLITGLALCSLLFSYLQLDNAGIISPREYLRSQLGSMYKTEHFDIYFAKQHYTEDEIRYWAAKQEFYFQQITERLDVEWPVNHRIETYLYAHAWQKKELTGAKFTSYVPIWLEQDQLHIAKQQLNAVLKHELVHVISKRFGNDLFNGSWSIGMIEGVAEAVAQDASSRSTLHQLVASQDPYPSSEDIKAALSFWGFYKKAGAISYTTTGSFVDHLLDAYPADTFKKAYRTTDIEGAYGRSIDSLVSEWHEDLQDTPVDSVDRERSEYLFGQLSLFQKTCPHSISKEWSLWDHYQYQLAKGDTASAYQTMQTLHELSVNNDWVTDEWAQTQLHQMQYEKVITAIADTSHSLPLSILKADALFMSGRYNGARKWLSGLAPEIRNASSSIFDHSLDLRSDSLQWSYHTGRRYLNFRADQGAFRVLNESNQMLSLQTAIRDRDYEAIKLYTQLILEQRPNIDPEWFSIAVQSLDNLVYRGEFETARELWETLSQDGLRLQYQHRLEQQKEWMLFMQDHISVAD